MAVILYDLCAGNPALRFSPYCWRAKLALAHKGLDFDSKPVPFTRIAEIEGAPKTLPVLDDDGRPVGDSFEIALHLDETYPDRPSLFDGEASIAAARFLEGWAFLSFHGIITRMVVKDIHDALGETDQAYFRPNREARFGRPLEEHQTGVEANAEALGTALEPLRRTLARHEWLGTSRSAA